MVVYDSQVKQQLEEYDISLKSYPISASRRKEKVRRLRQFLQSIGRNVLSYPICDSKKLGQLYDVGGNAILNILRQTHYQDESGTQWRMSFFMVSKNVVKVYRLYQSQFVDESFKTRNINKFKIEYKDNTMKTNKKVIRLTESDLRKMVNESVRIIISEDIGDGSFPNSDALLGHSIKRIEQALAKEGFTMDEYGDDIYGNGCVYFTNDEGITVSVSYPWIKNGKNSYHAGKVNQADVY